MSLASRLRARPALLALWTALALSSVEAAAARAADRAPGAPAPTPAADAPADVPAAPAQPDQVAAAPTTEVVVVSQRSTRSAVSLGAPEIQKLLPGINPLKALQTLPGVLFESSDPVGNNEQNESLFVHGFSTQQLGYTLDGVPLGDQQYGNYNGLSPSRALSSENVSAVTLSSGAGALGVASTSNLGGAIETFSRDPSKDRDVDIRQTFGSHDDFRTFARFDTGTFGDGNTLSLSYLRQDARAWDFDGHQHDDQVNAKFEHEGVHGKLTVFLDWDSKVEPNEDSTGFGNQAGGSGRYTPYTRPFIYPNLQAGLDYLKTGALPGSPPVAAGNNFSNYFSAAQRDDDLGYVKYEWNLADGMTWSNQAYGHYDFGRGIVAGPINQAGLPGLFGAYFPQLVVGGTGSATSLQNISNLFGGTGYEVRTTEYKVARGGLISTFDWRLGDHRIEAGVWYEHNRSTQHRAWYPFSDANDDLTPYDTPHGPAVFEQYAFQFDTDVVQFHLQDQWRILPTLSLQAGFKTSYQNAGDQVLVQQKNAPTANPPTLYPTGSITTSEGFLPEVGALWEVTSTEQVFANVQKNLRQFVPYGAGSSFYGSSPWSLGSQAAFDLFKETVKPETSWTYEVGVRTNRPVAFGPLTSVQGQVNYYHVDFSNRLFNIAAFNFINPGASILVNVGGVTSNGVDLAATLNLGPHLHFYDGVSYNKSTYDSGYRTGAAATLVPTGGKQVPLTAQWLNKTILSTNFGPFEAQINADYIGDRPATYLNDLYIKPTFVLGLEASYNLAGAVPPWAKSAKVMLNITNLADEHGVSTAVVTGASGGYQAFPLAPRMAFVTLQADF